MIIRNKCFQIQRYSQEADMRRFFSLLTGMFMGALVGATMAILLAPESGESLRLQLRERASHFRQDVMEAAAARRAELEEQLSTLRAPKA
jgi:gas vesicle protein